MSASNVNDALMLIGSNVFDVLGTLELLMVEGGCSASRGRAQDGKRSLWTVRLSPEEAGFSCRSVRDFREQG